MESVRASRKPPALDPRIPRALFLDVDGTLLEIAPSPDLVQVPERLKALVSRLARQYSGAVAFVSGRTIAQLDRLFQPLRLPSSGMHGIERRDAQGVFHRPSLPHDRLARAQSFLEAIVQVNPGLLLENKHSTVAVHYRLAPELEPVARRVMEQALQILGNDYVLLEGKMVLEIKPDGFSKSMAIAAFLRETPFQGRAPIFLGDDHTDEAGFTYVEGLGGTAIHVGANEASHARWRLSTVNDVHDWLETLAVATAARSTAR